MRLISPPVSDSFVRTFILTPKSSFAGRPFEGALIAYSIRRKLPSGGTKERADVCSNLESLRGKRKRRQRGSSLSRRRRESTNRIQGWKAGVDIGAGLVNVKRRSGVPGETKEERRVRFEGTDLKEGRAHLRAWCYTRYDQNDQFVQPDRVWESRRKRRSVSR